MEYLYQKNESISGYKLKFNFKHIEHRSIVAVYIVFENAFVRCNYHSAWGNKSLYLISIHNWNKGDTHSAGYFDHIIKLLSKALRNKIKEISTSKYREPCVPFLYQSNMPKLKKIKIGEIVPLLWYEDGLTITYDYKKKNFRKDWKEFDDRYNRKFCIKLAKSKEFINMDQFEDDTEWSSGVFGGTKRDINLIFFDKFLKELDTVKPQYEH